MSSRGVVAAVVVSVLSVGCAAFGAEQAEPYFPPDQDVVRTVYGPESESLAVERPVVDSAARRHASEHMVDRDVVRTVWGPQSDPWATGEPTASVRDVHGWQKGQVQVTLAR